MERLPSDGSRWYKIGSPTGIKFEVKEQDPIFSVETTWHKDLKRYAITRADEFPGSSYRLIYQVNHPVNPFLNRIIYTVCDKKLSTTKSIGIVVYQGRQNLEIELASATHFILSNYNYNSLDRVTFFAFDKTFDEKLEFLRRRSFKENLLDLASMFTMKGEIVFYPEADIADKQRINYAKDLQKSEINEKLEKLTEDEKAMLTNVLLLTGSALKEHLEGKLNDEELRVFYQLLREEVLSSAPAGIEILPLEDAALKLSEILVEEVEWLLAENYAKVASMSDLVVTIKFDHTNQNQAKLVLEDTGAHTFHEHIISNKEVYKFEEYSYKIENIDGEFCFITIMNLLRSFLKFQISLPINVDTQEIYQIISTPESSGWERVLEMVPGQFSQSS